MGGGAASHISGLRLQRSLAVDQARSIFDEAGRLTPEAIQRSAPLPIGQLRNTKLLEELSARPGNLSDWEKYTTSSTPSPSGNFQMHFYHNPVTRDVYYGMDYKAIFDHQGSWSFAPSPKFVYELPPLFLKP
ncbi:hypothetical protein BH10PSE19_BH10PSE19_20640 [soil metagenome]